MTAACREGRVLRLVQISDCHLGADPGEMLRGCDPDRRLQAVVEALRREGADLVVATGDLSNDGSLASYRRLRRHLGRLSCQVCCLPGNHDTPAVMRRVLSRRPVRMVEAIRRRGWQICLLDTSVAGRCGGRLSAHALTGLERRLERHPGRPTFVFMHHPPLPCGSSWLDEDMLLDNPEELFRLLARHRQVRGLAWGHIHQPFEVRRGALTCFGTPATAMQFTPSSPDFDTTGDGPAYRRFVLGRDGHIESEIVYLDGVE